MATERFTDHTIRIKPSRNLQHYLTCTYRATKSASPKTTAPPAKEDFTFLQSLNLENTKSTPLVNTDPNGDYSLSLQDLYHIYHHLNEENHKSVKKIYLHDLLQGSQIVLPRENRAPRNPELEERCNKLRVQQENKRYYNMTKDVDSVRKNHPEDSLPFQLQQMNRHLVAVFQFVLSVVAGFAFGVFGVELIVGNLYFGSRIVLGIILALLVAVAELYFLVRKIELEEKDTRV